MTTARIIPSLKELALKKYLHARINFDFEISSETETVIRQQALEFSPNFISNIVNGNMKGMQDVINVIPEIVVLKIDAVTTVSGYTYKDTTVIQLIYLLDDVEMFKAIVLPCILKLPEGLRIQAKEQLLIKMKEVKKQKIDFKPYNFSNIVDVITLDQSLKIDNEPNTATSAVFEKFKVDLTPGIISNGKSWVKENLEEAFHVYVISNNKWRGKQWNKNQKTWYRINIIGHLQTLVERCFEQECSQGLHPDNANIRSLKVKYSDKNISLFYRGSSDQTLLLGRDYCIDVLGGEASQLDFSSAERTWHMLSRISGEKSNQWEIIKNQLKYYVINQDKLTNVPSNEKLPRFQYLDFESLLKFKSEVSLFKSAIEKLSKADVAKTRFSYFLQAIADGNEARVSDFFKYVGNIDQLMEGVGTVITPSLDTIENVTAIQLAYILEDERMGEVLIDAVDKSNDNAIKEKVRQQLQIKIAEVKEQEAKFKKFDFSYLIQTIENDEKIKSKGKAGAETTKVLAIFKAYFQPKTIKYGRPFNIKDLQQCYDIFAKKWDSWGVKRLMWFLHNIALRLHGRVAPSYAQAFSQGLSQPFQRSLKLKNRCHGEANGIDISYYSTCHRSRLIFVDKFYKKFFIDIYEGVFGGGWLYYSSWVSKLDKCVEEKRQGWDSIIERLKFKDVHMERSFKNK